MSEPLTNTTTMVTITPVINTNNTGSINSLTNSTTTTVNSVNSPQSVVMTNSTDEGIVNANNNNNNINNNNNVNNSSDGNMNEQEMVDVKAIKLDDDAPNDDNKMQIEDEEEDLARAEATFSFTIPHITTLDDQVLSKPFYVRNLPWKIMILPKPQNINRAEIRALGYFLQCNAESDSTTWSCAASAKLRLISYRTDSPPFERQIKHAFNPRENDWGFSTYISYIDMLEPTIEYVRNDTIKLEVYVKAEAPHGVGLWDSKKQTGYVGLKNQGATCYMNSLLQTLFFTNYLRRSVYKMPTEADDGNKSIALALQRIFHDLQFTDKPVGTKKLTKSFGWDALDSFMQHDVQEFLRLLLDKLESKMKHTCVEGTIPKLLEGKMSSYIKCKNVNYTSTRTETFYDIQLNIKGKKNIYDSFEDYIAKETLDGDNKYDAGEHGFQDAEKGVIFVQFPPVLHLHLMRFQYDPLTDSSVKSNDRFEFYDHINLNAYLHAPDKTGPADYTLHAVLVHSGDNNTGHYVVYINTNGDGKWCKFDDDAVSRSSISEAIEQNFGGIDDELTFNVRSNSSAYMLVYIRDLDMPEVLCDVSDSDIPYELKERISEDRRIETIRRHEKTTANDYVTVNVLLEEHLESHDSTDIFDYTNYRIFKIKKSQTVAELFEMFEQSFLMNSGRMRIWQLTNRSNTIVRPVLFDHKELLGKNIHHCAELQNQWTIFLELLQPDCQLYQFPPFDRELDILLFFKMYNPDYKRLHYVGMATYTLKETTLRDLVKEFNSRLHWPLETKLTLYEEQANNVLQKLSDQTETLDKSLRVIREIMDSSILIFERAECDPNLELPTCEDYFRDLLHRIQITFCDKNKVNDPGFQLELLQRITYNEIASAVGTKINVDPYQLQFFKVQNHKDMPGNPVNAAFEGTLEDLVTTTKSTKGVKKLFYQKLTMNINEFENKRQFKCIYLAPNLKDEKELTFYMNNNATIKNLLDEAATQIKFTEDSSRVLRFIVVHNHKASLGPSEDTQLEALSAMFDLNNSTIASGIVNQKIYRIEEVPNDELNLNEDEAMLIPVAHFCKDTYNTFGIPFFVKAIQDEPFIIIKDRIQKKLNLSVNEFERYKLGVITMGGRPEYITDDSQIINLNDFKFNVSGAIRSYFGLEHINRTQKRSRYNYSEKALKIYN